MRYLVCLATVKDPAGKAADLRRFLMDHNLWSQVTAEFEPLVRIGFVDDKPAFHSPENEELFNKVLDAGNEGVLGVTSAPGDELSRLDGQVFLYGEKVIRVVYRPAEEKRWKPYARRLVRLVRGNVDAGFVSASDSDFDGHPVLLNPSMGRLSREKTVELVQRMMKVGRQGSFLLPPVFESAEPDSYFSQDETPRTEVRQDLARLNGIVEFQPEEPAAFSMWRLCDHALWRDILAEGGTITIPRYADAVKTTLELKINADAQAMEDDPIHAYRHTFLFNADSLPGPDWGPGFSRAMCDDLEKSLPVQPDGNPWIKVSVDTGPAVSWRILPPSGAGYKGQEEGNWSNLSDMCQSFTRQEYRDFFHEEVLWPSRNNDHDLAERRFIENFWRCPWSSETRPGPWRLVMGGDLILLGHELRGGVRPVPKRHAAWPDRPPPRLSKRPDGWVLEHTAASDDRILQWRLLLPLGTLICRHQVFRIGIGRLNQGYVLTT